MSFNDAVLEVSRKFQTIRILSPSPIPMGEGRGEGFHGQWFERPHHDPEHKSNGSRGKHNDS
jgi:hypothetical protein